MLSSTADGHFQVVADAAVRRNMFNGGSASLHLDVQRADIQQAEIRQTGMQRAVGAMDPDDVEDTHDHLKNQTSEDNATSAEVNLNEEPAGCSDARKGESRWLGRLFRKKDAAQSNTDRAAKLCKRHKSERKSALKAKAQIEKLADEIRDIETKKGTEEELLNAKIAALKDMEANLDKSFGRIATATGS